MMRAFFLLLALFSSPAFSAGAWIEYPTSDLAVAACVSKYGGFNSGGSSTYAGRATWWCTKTTVSGYDYHFGYVNPPATCSGGKLPFPPLSQCKTECTYQSGIPDDDPNCHAPCPAGEYWIDGSCQAPPTCSAGQVFDVITATCVTNTAGCSGGQVYNSDFDSCNCGPGKFMFNGQCTEEQAISCPWGQNYSVSAESCVANAPPPVFGGPLPPPIYVNTGPIGANGQAPALEQGEIQIHNCEGWECYVYGGGESEQGCFEYENDPGQAYCAYQPHYSFICPAGGSCEPVPYTPPQTVDLRQYTPNQDATYPPVQQPESVTYPPAPTQYVPPQTTQEGSGYDPRVITQCTTGYTYDPASGLCKSGYVPPTPSTTTDPGSPGSPGTVSCPVGYTLINGTCTGQSIAAPPADSSSGDGSSWGSPPPANPDGQTTEEGGEPGSGDPAPDATTGKCPAGYTLENGKCKSSGTVTGEGSEATEGTLDKLLKSIFNCEDAYCGMDLIELPTYEFDITEIELIDLDAPAAICPENISLPRGLEWKWDSICEFAEFLNPFIVALAWLSAASILITGFRD